MKELYEQHKEIEGKKGKKHDKETEEEKGINQDKKTKEKNKTELYYLKTLAKALNKTEQAISETVKTLIKMGVVKSEEEAGPSKGKIKCLDLTEDGLLIWNVLTPPTKDEIKDVIISYKKRGQDINAYRIAIELGKNPNDKMVMDLIYAVMALPEIKDYKGEITILS